jgi:hypothetical protein
LNSFRVWRTDRWLIEAAARLACKRWGTWPEKVLWLLGERFTCIRCCAAAGLWYRRPMTEAGYRALIAYKRMNWFANPPRAPKGYRNPRGFRKKEVKLQAALVALGKATRPKE